MNTYAIELSFFGVLAVRVASAMRLRRSWCWLAFRALQALKRVLLRPQERQRVR